MRRKISHIIDDLNRASKSLDVEHNYTLICLLNESAERLQEVEHLKLLLDSKTIELQKHIDVMSSNSITTQQT